MKIKLFLSQLYDQDYCLWLEQNIQFLRFHQFQKVDIENLIEEIEDMGKSQKQALKSNLRILLMHLLKWQYQANHQSNSWRSTIREHRNRLEDAFSDSPSLKPFFTEVKDECYQKARYLAADETNLTLDTFPEVCPFSLEEILNTDYLPDLKDSNL